MQFWCKNQWKYYLKLLDLHLTKGIHNDGPDIIQVPLPYPPVRPASFFTMSIHSEITTCNFPKFRTFFIISDDYKECEYKWRGPLPLISPIKYHQSTRGLHQICLKELCDEIQRHFHRHVKTSMYSPEILTSKGASHKMSTMWDVYPFNVILHGKEYLNGVGVMSQDNGC